MRPVGWEMGEGARGKREKFRKPPRFPLREVSYVSRRPLERDYRKGANLRAIGGRAVGFVGDLLSPSCAQDIRMDVVPAMD